MKQIPASLLTLLAGILITLVSLWVGQHHNLLPEQASEQAPMIDRFFSLMVTIGTALFLVVQGAILLFSIQFRKRDGDDTDGLPIEGNFSLEVLWTAIPALIVIALGVYSVEVYQQMGGFTPVGSHSMAHMQSTNRSAIAAPLVAQSTASDTPSQPIYGFSANPDAESKPADLVVNVTGMQYAWLFNYPGSEITAGALHIPVGKDIQLNLTGQDVIHSFWVPQFRLKQDALPGLHNELRFVATKLGTYPIVCAELCGSYHGSMRSQVVVEPQEAFEQWLQENQVAQKDHPHVAVALNPADLSPAEFLAPYAKEIGVRATDLEKLHTHHH